MGAILKPSFKPYISAERIRDSHHNVARLAASGLAQNEIASRCGFTPSRISMLLQSPAMQELVSYYRAQVNEAWSANRDHYFELVFSNMVKAERMIADQLDDAEEGATAPKLKDLITIARDGADRTGYMKKEARLNVSASFASQLEAAITRSKQVQGETEILQLPQDNSRKNT